MAWLTSLLKKPAEAEPAFEELPVDEMQAVTGPGIAVLVPDTAGISSFRIAMMPDSYSAAEYIASLKPSFRHETHAFWALHDKPIVDANTHVEALVLIRADEDSDLVYIVSFLDVESAYSFTRFEVRRGLHLGNVMIYWAAFAQLREELDGISITPPFAPPTEGYSPPRLAPEIRHPQPQASTAVIEPEAVPEPAIEPPPSPEPAREPPLAPEQTTEAPRGVQLPAEEDPAEIQRTVEEYLNRIDKPRQRIRPEPERAAAIEPPPAREERPVVSFEPQVAERQPTAQPVAESATPVEMPQQKAGEDEDLGPLWPDATPQATTAAPQVSAPSQAAPRPQVVRPPELTPPPAEPPASEPTPEPEVSSPVAAEQAAIDEAFVFQHKSIEGRPAHHPTKLETAGAENGMIVEDRPGPLPTFRPDDATVKHMAERMSMTRRDASLQELAARLTIGEPEPGVETIAGDEELEFVPLNSADPANEFAADPKIDDFDIAYEVERLLRGRKWEQRDGPFSGFQSPPGRF